LYAQTIEFEFRTALFIREKLNIPFEKEKEGGEAAKMRMGGIGRMP
jgi:hypothetical protein